MIYFLFIESDKLVWVYEHGFVIFTSVVQFPIKLIMLCELTQECIINILLPLI